MTSSKLNVVNHEILSSILSEGICGISGFFWGDQMSSKVVSYD